MVVRDLTAPYRAAQIGNALGNCQFERCLLGRVQRSQRSLVETEGVVVGVYYASAIARIKAIPGYADLFRKEFPGDPDPVTPDNWAKAIG